jgi:hypothetical protein
MIKMKEINCCEAERCFEEIGKNRRFCVRHCQHLRVQVYKENWDKWIECKDCSIFHTNVGDNPFGQFIVKVMTERGQKIMGEEENEKIN